MLLTRHRAAFLCVPLLALALPACGLRRDETASVGVRPARIVPVAEAVDNVDPAALQPSFREMRQARIDAWAEADSMAGGGNIAFRSDGSSSRPNAVEFVAEKGALFLEISADNRLNLAGGVPHALTLSVYHLSDRAALDRLAASDEGMRTLLAGGHFDASVRSVRRIAVQPGMRTALPLDRPDGGRYVAIAAGYHNLAPAAVLFAAPYEIGQYALPGTWNIMRDRTMFHAKPLRLRLELEEDGMRVYRVGRTFVSAPKGGTIHNARFTTGLLQTGD